MKPMTTALRLACAVLALGSAIWAWALDPVAAWRYPWVAPSSGNVALVLEGGLGNGKDIQLDFAQRGDGVWGPDVLGLANLWDRFGERPCAHNAEDHYGRLRAAKTDGANTVLDVAMSITPDRWVAGGAATYTITVTREGDLYTGAFAGTWNGRPVQGRAYGRARSMTRTLDAAPFVPGEHPRLLFRKVDIPGIRAKAETPEGKRILERLKASLAEPFHFGNGPGGRGPGYHATGRAFMYTLTGDRQWADQARELVEKMLVFPAVDMPDMRRGGFLTGVATAFDMCYDAWDPAFRDEVLRFLRRETPRWAVHTENNPSPHSNHHAGGAGAQGLLAMAALAEPGGAKPVFVDVAPVADLRSAGIPVVTLTPGKGIIEWAAAGPFTTVGAAEALAAARPALGAPLTCGDTTAAFAALSNTTVWNHPTYTRGVDTVDVRVAAGTPDRSAMYLFCVLDVTVPGAYGIETIPEASEQWFGEGQLDVRLFLGGRALARGDMVRLTAGRYPLLVEAQLGKAEKAGARLCMAPRFTRFSEVEATAEFARRTEAYSMCNGAAPLDVDRYLEVAYDDPVVRGWHHAQRGVVRWLQSGMDTGICTELHNYRQSTLRTGILPFLHSYRVCLGKEYVEDIGTRWLLPILAVRSIGNGRVVHEVGVGGIRDTRTEGAGNMMTGWRTIPEAWRPAMKALYDDVWGLPGDTTFDVTMPDNAVYALINYPVDLKPGLSEGVLPHFVGGTRKGAFTFRNRYENADDIIVPIWLRSETLGASWKLTDDIVYRVYGFGADWGVIPPMGAARRSKIAGASTKVYEADEAAKTALLVTDMAAPADGSAGDQYVRTLAVDYSGLSGAPGLFVLMERAKGAARWAWPTTGKVSARGADFTVAGPAGATIVGCFITPGTVSANGGTVSASSRNGLYITVFTMQKGDAPKIAVEGEGLGSVVTVGGRTVRFEGERVVFGER